MEVGMKDSLYLFNLEFGTRYLFPDANNLYLLERTWFGSPAILHPYLFTISSKISWREDGGGITIIFPTRPIRYCSCAFCFTGRLPNQLSDSFRALIGEIPRRAAAGPQCRNTFSKYMDAEYLKWMPSSKGGRKKSNAIITFPGK